MGESLGETLFGDWVWDVLGSFVLALRAAALGVLAVVAILVLAVLVLGVLSVVGVLVVLALGDFLGGGIFYCGFGSIFEVFDLFLDSA